MIVKLLTEHHLEFLRLTGGCKGLSQSTHDKILHCWKSMSRLNSKTGGGARVYFRETFVKIKSSQIGEITLSFTYIGKSRPCREFQRRVQRVF